MITINLYDWPRADELILYAAEHHLNLSEAIHELVNAGLSHR